MALIRYLVRRKPDATIGDVYIWTEILAKRKDLEEVYAENVRDALDSEGMPDANNISLGQLDAMTKEKVVIFGQKKLGLTLDRTKPKADLLYEVKVALFSRPVAGEEASAKAAPVTIEAKRETRALSPGQVSTQAGM